MRIAIIGRTEILYESALKLHAAGHEIACILTAKEALEYKRTAKDFSELAEKWEVPFAQGSRIIEHLAFLRDAKADIAVSINFTGVVPQEIIDVFPLGVLNAHGGDLPRYRGNACQAWAILNAEKSIGLCIHKMIGGELDSGLIIERDFLPIDINTRIGEAYTWMENMVPILMLSAVEKLSADASYVLAVQSKDPRDALRCYPRKPEDGRINWSLSAENVLRLINASSEPFSGAFCFVNQKKMIIWRAELVDDQEIFLAVPGQVTRISDKFIEVACGHGKLRLLRFEIENTDTEPMNGKPITSIRQRLN